MAAPGTSKRHPNPKKSPQILLETPMETPSQRALEKSGSWTLPGISPYASRTVPAMVLACSTRCLRTTFLLTLGLLLAPFLGPWAPKWRPGGEKGPSQKTLKNDLAKSSKKCPKHPPKSSEFLLPFEVFLASCL